MEFSFKFSPFLLLLILPIAGLLAWWMYRGTKEYLPRTPGIILGMFRFLVLSALGLLLLEPLLNYLTKVTYPPIVAVLQDVTESLVVQKDSNFVKEEYPQLLQGFSQGFTPENQVLDLWAYGNELQGKISPDSLRFNETGTNLTRSLQEVQKRYQNQNLEAIVLVSDGISTAGLNPLYSLDGVQQPVFTVLLGDTTEQRDVQIRDVLYNEIAYLNTEMPIRVHIHQNGYDRAALKVSLRNQNKTLSTKNLNLERNRNQGFVDFLIKPEEVGLQPYQVVVTRLEEEITYRNNSQRFFINVLETRIKVALFAGSPHPDIGAIHKTFEQEEGYELTEFILKQPGTFYQNPANFQLEEFDLIMLHNFPQSNRDRPVVQRIANLIEEKKTPVIYWVGMFSDLRSMEALYPYMALSPKSFNPRYDEVIPTFERDYKNHSTYTFPDDWISWINNAPPVYRNKSEWEPKSTAEVFATARIKNIQLDYPVYALQSQLGRKNMVFLGENIWRMRTHSYLETESFEYFDDWLINNLKWLTVADDKRKFKVLPSKRVFTGSEPAILKGQVYDDSYQPLPGVDIKVVLRDPAGKENDFYLKETGQAQYSLDLYNLTEGTYSYRAEGRKADRVIGTDQGSFSVGKSNIEHLQLQANKDLMQQIALRTGGEFIYARNIEELPDKIKALPGFKPDADFRNLRQNLTHFPWILGLILLLLCTEWVVRKVYSLL